MKKTTLLSSLLCLTALSFVFAPVVSVTRVWADDYQTDDAIKSDTKKAGHDVKAGTENAGHHVKEGSQKAGKKAKKGGKKAAKSTGKTVNDAGDRLNDLGNK